MQYEHKPPLPEMAISLLISSSSNFQQMEIDLNEQIEIDQKIDIGKQIGIMITTKVVRDIYIYIYICTLPPTHTLSQSSISRFVREQISISGNGMYKLVSSKKTQKGQEVKIKFFRIPFAN